MIIAIMIFVPLVPLVYMIASGEAVGCPLPKPNSAEPGEELPGGGRCEQPGPASATSHKMIP